jgi:hypothetical protein
MEKLVKKMDILSPKINPKFPKQVLEWLVDK